MSFPKRSKPCVFIGVSGILFLLILAASLVNAQIALQATLALRPVTPGEISSYKLPSTTESSPGTINVGLGQPAYLRWKSILPCRRPMSSASPGPCSTSQRVQRQSSPVVRWWRVCRCLNRPTGWWLKWRAARSFARTWWASMRSAPPSPPRAMAARPCNRRFLEPPTQALRLAPAATTVNSRRSIKSQRGP